MTGMFPYFSLPSFVLALLTTPAYRLFTVEHEIIVKYLVHHGLLTSGEFICHL